MWSFEECTTSSPKNKNLVLLNPISIIRLTRGMSLIGISATGVFVDEDYSSFPRILVHKKTYKDHKNREN